MKKYLPRNRNEYDLDGKRFIESVRSCSCDEKRGEIYVLNCEIHQRGLKEYSYKPGEACITRRTLGKMRLYLSDAALDQVLKAVADFESRTDEAQKWRSVSVPCRGSSIKIAYCQENGNLELYLEYVNGEETTKEFFGRPDPLRWLLSDTAEILYGAVEECESFEKHDLVMYSKKETVSENPVYRAAIGQNDQLFAAILKLHFGIADKSECAALSEYLKKRILPPLSEKFNKDYAVGGMIDYELLRDSGYRIFHRPYFAMSGYTHDMITLNPHTKRGLDAVPENAAGLTFCEFLLLFENDDPSKEEKE